MLFQNSRLHLVDTHVFLAILFDYVLYEGLSSLEDALRCEQPYPVDKSIHRDDFINTVQALRKGFGITRCTLSYELRVKLLSLRDLSISHLPLTHASLKTKIPADGN